MAQTYEAITTQTLGSNQSTITLSSIPQTYTDLIIIANGASTSGGSMHTKFNGDGGANYSCTFFYGDGSGIAGSRSLSQANGIFGARNGIGSQGGGIMRINNYSNTNTYKVMFTRQFGQDQIVWFSTGRWGNSAAITSISFTDESGGQFTTGFTITLYGIKAGSA
jgi:hypothetical protein